jgi:hypothetical protein
MAGSRRCGLSAKITGENATLAGSRAGAALHAVRQASHWLPRSEGEAGRWLPESSVVQMTPKVSKPA